MQHLYQCNRTIKISSWQQEKVSNNMIESNQHKDHDWKPHSYYFPNGILGDHTLVYTHRHQPIRTDCRKEDHRHTWSYFRHCHCRNLFAINIHLSQS